MKVFLSWSGERSKAVAGILKDWLKRLIHPVDTFFTPDMEKGAKWSNEIDDALEGTRFGIVCLTPDNLTSTWIHFETGALSKTRDASIWTFLHGLTPSQVPQPLGKFQHTINNKEDIFKLFQAINNKVKEIGEKSVDDTDLKQFFDETWEKYQSLLKDTELLSIKTEETIDVTKPDEMAVLNEILETVRDQQRQMNIFEMRLDNFTSPISASIKRKEANKHLSKLSDDINIIGFNMLKLSFESYLSAEESAEVKQFMLLSLDEKAIISVETGMSRPAQDPTIIKAYLSGMITSQSAKQFESLIQNHFFHPIFRVDYFVRDFPSDDDIPF